MNATAVRGDWVGRVIDGRFTLLQWLGGSERSSVFLTELPGDQPQKAVIKLIPADAAGAEAQMCIRDSHKRLRRSGYPAGVVHGRAL